MNFAVDTRAINVLAHDDGSGAPNVRNDCPEAKYVVLIFWFWQVPYLARPLEYRILGPGSCIFVAYSKYIRTILDYSQSRNSGVK